MCFIHKTTSLALTVSHPISLSEQGGDLKFHPLFVSVNMLCQYGDRWWTWPCFKYILPINHQWTSDLWLAIVLCVYEKIACTKYFTLFCMAFWEVILSGIWGDIILNKTIYSTNCTHMAAFHWILMLDLRSRNNNRRIPNAVTSLCIFCWCTLRREERGGVEPYVQHTYADQNNHTILHTSETYQEICNQSYDNDNAIIVFINAWLP